MLNMKIDSLHFDVRWTVRDKMFIYLISGLKHLLLCAHASANIVERSNKK